MSKVIDLYKRFINYCYSKKILCFIGLCFNIMMIATPIYIFSNDKILFGVLSAVSYLFFNVPAGYRCINSLIDN